MLREERFILRKAGSATRSASNKVLEQLGISESSLNVIATLNDQEATKNLVEAGCGIAMLSELAVRDRVKAGRMLAFDVPGAEAFREFYVVRRKNARLSELAEAFFDYVMKQNDE